MTKKSSTRQERDHVQSKMGMKNPSPAVRLVSNRQQENRIKQYYQNNTCWDDVNAVSHSVMDMLNQHTSIADIVSNERLMVCVENKRTLANNIQILSKDLLTLLNELNAIRAHHANRSGGAKTEEENFEAIKIYEQYVALKERYDALIMPTFLQIQESLHQAEVLYGEVLSQLGQEGVADYEAVQKKALELIHQQSQYTEQQKKDLALAQAQDPNVVTDVEAKIVH